MLSTRLHPIQTLAVLSLMTVRPPLPGLVSSHPLAPLSLAPLPRYFGP